METPIEINMMQHVLNGDLRGLDELLDQPHEKLRAMERTAGPHVLSHQALITVLSGLKTGEYSREQAQRLASFVRAGFAGGSSEPPIQPLDIAYESDWEDQIVEILARLDESLDAEDHPLDNAEIEGMVAQLSNLQRGNKAGS